MHCTLGRWPAVLNKSHISEVNSFIQFLNIFRVDIKCFITKHHQNVFFNYITPVKLMSIYARLRNFLFRSVPQNITTYRACYILRNGTEQDNGWG